MRHSRFPASNMGRPLLQPLREVLPCHYMDLIRWKICCGFTGWNCCAMPFGRYGTVKTPRISFSKSSWTQQNSNGDRSRTRAAYLYRMLGSLISKFSARRQRERDTLTKTDVHRLWGLKRDDGATEAIAQIEQAIDLLERAKELPDRQRLIWESLVLSDGNERIQLDLLITQLRKELGVSETVVSYDRDGIQARLEKKAQDIRRSAYQSIRDRIRREHIEIYATLKHFNKRYLEDPSPTNAQTVLDLRESIRQPFVPNVLNYLVRRSEAIESVLPRIRGQILEHNGTCLQFVSLLDSEVEKMVGTFQTTHHEREDWELSPRQSFDSRCQVRMTGTPMPRLPQDAPDHLPLNRFVDLSRSQEYRRPQVSDLPLSSVAPRTKQQLAADNAETTRLFIEEIERLNAIWDAEDAAKAAAQDTQSATQQPESDEKAPSRS